MNPSEEDYRKMIPSQKIQWLADYNYFGHAIDEELHPIVDEVAQLEAEIERLEKEKHHWWIIACKRFASLTEIAEASDKPDDYEWYETGYGMIPVGVDESNSGDWHSHGYGMGVWAMAKKARDALNAGDIGE